MQAFLRAAEGIRTLDLLHGKQSMGLSWARKNACKRTTSERLDRGLAFRELCGDTGGLDKERTMSDP
jgi:hypothetical protein